MLLGCWIGVPATLARGSYTSSERKKLLQLPMFKICARIILIRPILRVSHLLWFLLLLFSFETLSCCSLPLGVASVASTSARSTTIDVCSTIQIHFRVGCCQGVRVERLKAYRQPEGGRGGRTAGKFDS